MYRELMCHELMFEELMFQEFDHELMNEKYLTC